MEAFIFKEGNNKQSVLSARTSVTYPFPKKKKICIYIYIMSKTKLVSIKSRYIRGTLHRSMETTRMASLYRYYRYACIGASLCLYIGVCKYIYIHTHTHVYMHSIHHQVWYFHFSRQLIINFLFLEFIHSYIMYLLLCQHIYHMC